MTDITELAQSLKASAKKATKGQWVAFTDTATRTFSVHTPDDARCENIIKWAGFDCQKNAKSNAEFIALANPANILALVEALEHYKSREERVTSLVRNNSKSWDELYRQVEAKGKRNVELVEALEKEKTKADVYDMLRDDYGLREKGVGLADFVDWQAKRIAELESRTVKLPDDAEHDIMAPVAAYLSEKFKWDGGAARWDGRKEYDVLADRVKYALRMVIRRAAGIKWEAE